MIRLLLIIAIAVVAWYLYRRIIAGPGSNKGTPAAPPSSPVASGQDVVTRCEECGVHVPEKNGVRYQGLFFCSPEHLTEHLRKNGKS